MTQESRSQSSADESKASDYSLADRLDAASVERVISRALELESEDPAPSGRIEFTPAQVERIAGELGIESEFIRRAITEIRTSPPKDRRSRLDRFFLPEQLIESQAVEGLDAQQLERLISEWMTTREGMRLIDRSGHGGEWEVDPHWMTKLRTSLNSDSGRLSRIASGPIRHQVDSIDQFQHVMALEADETIPQRIGRAGIVFGGLATLGFWLGAFFGALGGFAPATTIAFLLLGAFVGAGVVATFGAAIRGWGRRIKRRLRTTLFRIANREDPPPGSKLGDFISSVFGRIPS